MHSGGWSAFLWDVDGTIIDSRQFAFDATNYVLEHFGKRTFNAEEFRQIFSSDYRLHLNRMGINSGREISFLEDAWNVKLAAEKSKFRLYDGVLDILSYLHKRGHKMALVTSTSRRQIQLYFDLFGIDKFFSTLVAREDVDEQKPSAKPLLKAAERLDVSCRDCVVIDDADDGVEAAKKIGATTIGVTWGFNTSSRISTAKPDFIAETPSELHKIIVEKLNC